MRYCLVLLLTLASLLQARDTGSRVLYVGGTVTGIQNKEGAHVDVGRDDALTLQGKNTSLSVPYRDVTTVEYGMRVNRRYIEAALISPVFLIAKRRTHFLTIGYTDAEGRQQAMVLQVAKEDIRPLLVCLEARTGRRVEYQDEDARRAGKG